MPECIAKKHLPFVNHLVEFRSLNILTPGVILRIETHQLNTTASSFSLRAGRNVDVNLYRFSAFWLRPYDRHVIQKTCLR